MDQVHLLCTGMVDSVIYCICYVCVGTQWSTRRVGREGSNGAEGNDG